MISVTPLTKSSETAARRVSAARAIALVIAVAALVTIAVGQLADLTGDRLSASVLVLVGLVTIIAIIAPRQARLGHG